MIAGLRRNAVPLAIALATIAAFAFVVASFGRGEVARYDAAHRAVNRSSEVRLALAIHHDTGPVLDESWALRDLDGVSSATYRVAGRDGVTITVTMRPHATTDVSFAFGAAVVDGIWELPSRPPRGDATTHYRFSVFQEIDGRHGSRTFSLTDPHYWATTGGHQMQIRLDAHTSVRDSLLNVTSTTVVEPRYERLVTDVEGFGSPEFLAKTAQSRARIVRGTGAKGARPA